KGRCRVRSLPSRARSNGTTGARAPRSRSGTCTSRRTASTAPSATTSSSAWRPPRRSKPRCGARLPGRSSCGGDSSMGSPPRSTPADRDCSPTTLVGDRAVLFQVGVLRRLPELTKLVAHERIHPCGEIFRQLLETDDLEHVCQVAQAVRGGHPRRQLQLDHL